MGHRSAVERFVHNLRASIGKWKMADDTVALYVSKLSSWRLSEDQWARAVSRIISENTTGELPTLPAIYAYLKAVDDKPVRPTDLGWMKFTLNGLRHAVRIKSVNGHWTLAPCVVHNQFGKEVILQKRPGDAAIPPYGAEDVHFLADNPTPTEQCSQKEAREAFREGWVESGADPGKCDAMFAWIDSMLHGEVKKRVGDFTHISEPVSRVMRETAEVAIADDDVPF